MEHTSNHRLALVIGCGAVKCAAALGVWKVLARQGIAIDLLVGCSGGSQFAATMALGYSVDECIELTQRLWNRSITQKRDTRSLLKALLPQVFKFDERFGMIDDRAMLKNLRDVFGERSFSETLIPLHILATDFHTGEPVVLNQGSLVDALRASIAIPMIIPPWQLGEHLLVDGAVSDPLPVDVAIKEGGQVIVAIGFELPTRKRMRSYTAVTAHLNNLYMNNILQATFAFHNLAHHAEVVLVLPELDQTIGAFSAEQFPSVIAEGARAARQQLPYLKRLLS